MNEIIRLNNINKIYESGELNVHALKDINLSVMQGEYIAIMGASGSGKSTLMNILGCLDRASSGEYLLNGEDVSKLSDNELAYVRNRTIGFVFQSYNLIAQNNALQNVELPMLYAGVRGAREREERAVKLLKEVGLEDRITHLPKELSGGQKQRVAIARAMVNNPGVILADEPTGNLDSKASVEIMDIFTRLNREKNVTVIMVTHERDIAEFTDRIISFKDGEIISDESLSDKSVTGGNAYEVH